MSYRGKLSTVLISSIFLFGAAVLIWGYQTGKIVIFGSQQTSEVTSTFDSQADLSQGETNGLIDISSDGLIRLKPADGTNASSGFPTNQVGIYTSPSIGKEDVVSFSAFSPVGENKPTGTLSQSFSDVLTDNWAFKQIEALYRAGVTNGCPGTPLKYCPAEVTTREHLATMIVRAYYFPESVPSPQHPGSFYFPDVAAGSAFDSEIGLAKELGIVQGFNNSTSFAPKDNTTRAQVAVCLTRALRLDTTGFDPNNQSTWAVNFTDVKPTDFAWAEIQAAYKAGVISGYPDGTFRPTGVVDRSQMAAFIAKAYPAISNLTTQFIVYQFSGSADGNTWSPWKTGGTVSGTSFRVIQKAQAQTINNLSSLLPPGSKFMRTRIILSALNSSAAPSLSGFAVSFAVSGATSTSDATATASTGKLVSTGSSLWFNLLIAAIIAAVIAYLVLRRKKV